MVDIIGKAKVVVETAIDKSSLDASGNKIGAGLKKGALVGVAALGTLAVGAVGAYKAFEEAESVSRKLNQVLDNMGQSKAAPAVEELADELRKLTGVDDEVIKKGQTLLATFSEIAKTADENNGLFERATRVSLDLAAAGFGSVESASIQLGKALQEPAKGVAALAKTGAFTKAQQEYVKALDETGKKAEAQAYILKVLEDQVAGTAEASATESAKISTALGEIQETLGGMVEELLTGDEASGSFADSLERVNEELTEFSESEGWETAKTAIGGIGEAFNLAGEFLSAWSDRWETIGANTGMVVDEFVRKFDNMVTDISDDWHVFKQNIGDTVDEIQTIVKNVPGNLLKGLKSWGSAGSKLIGEFISGLAQGVVPGGSGGAIAQRIKDAINKALPDSLTFFGGRGGIPAITVDLPQLATGARNFRGGLAVVGETGPELVSLPAGSDVYSNSESRGMSGGGNTNNFYITGPTSLAELRQQADWYNTYGTRFGGAT